MTGAWLFAVPLLDTSTLIWRHCRERRSTFAADQHHLHHAFLGVGYSVEDAWAAISLLPLLLAGIGLPLEFNTLPQYLSFYAYLEYFSGVLLLYQA
jgi:UDP-GlcNAc:undecaprenyl-phosphate GlcNAc-1-phosphate transferase